MWLCGRPEGYRPSEDIVGDIVFYYCGQVRLVDDREHPVGTLDCVRHEACVLDDKDLVLLHESDRILVPALI